MKENFKSQPLLVELLAWLARTPPSYAETMDAWATSCPRLSVWKNAWIGDLVSVEVATDGPMKEIVSLTAVGRILLDEASRQPIRNSRQK